MSTYPSRIIRLYHGGTSSPKVEKALHTIAARIDSTDNSREEWFFDKSLDVLETTLHAVGVMFFTMMDGDVYITHHNSWSAR